MNTNFKLAARQLFRNKPITVIKLTGLVLGFTLSVLLLHYAWFEFSYDNFHPNAPNIYRIETVGYKGDEVFVGCATSDPAWGPVLKSDFPEVKDFARVFVMKHDRVVKYNDIKCRENRIYTADPSFFRIFNYPLVNGNPGTVLDRPNTVVISESMARKYFRNTNPVGKILEISSDKKFESHEVTGVFRDFPVNSNLKYDFIISWETIRSAWPEVETFWNIEFYYTYLLLNDNASPANMERQSPTIFQRYSKCTETSKGLRLVPLCKIHLKQPQQWEMETKGNRTVTWVIVALGVAILLIALMNQVNIIVSQSLERSKTIGLRQLLGSGKAGVIGYFIYESVLINLAVLLFSGMLIFLASPFLTGISVSFAPQELFCSLSFWLIVACEMGCSILVSGLLSGFAFSRLNLLPLLKGAHKTSAGGMFVRKGFTVFQFAISIGFIVATWMVYRQMDFVSKKDIGVDMQQVLAIRTPVGEDVDAVKMECFKMEVLKIPGVSDVAVSSDIPGRHGSCGMAIRRVLSDPKVQIVNIMTCDNRYLSAYGIQLIAGKNFTDVPENNTTSVLLNEKAVALLNTTPEKVIGHNVYNSELNNEPYRVIGVMKNFNQLSLREDYSPMMILYEGFPWLSTDFFSIKMRTKNVAQIMSGIDREWKRIFPSSIKDFFFVDRFYNEQYQQDQLLGKVLILFSILSIFISCLGVFAVSLFYIQQKVKEIGIRKVNGARVIEVMAMLNRDFVKWVAIAFVLATPVAYYAMYKWLENFAYKTELSWWVFALSGLLAVAVAILTVSFQSWKAATRNPVEALRYE